jgi:hypothetical protein
VSVPLASADFEVFRDQATSPNLPVSRSPLAGFSVREGPSPEVRLPFRVPPGCAARAAFAVFVAPALAGHQLSLALGSASPGVLRPYDVCSGCPVSAAIDSTDRGRRGLPRPRPVPPSGFVPRPSSPCGALDRLSLPLGGLSRADFREPELPRTRSSADATPRSTRDLSPTVARRSLPRPSLGFALQSFPFPRSRAASRRPCASLRVRRRP